MWEDCPEGQTEAQTLSEERTGGSLTRDPLLTRAFGAIISRQGSNAILATKLLSFFLSKKDRRAIFKQ